MGSRFIFSTSGDDACPTTKKRRVASAVSWKRYDEREFSASSVTLGGAHGEAPPLGSEFWPLNRAVKAATKTAPEGRLAAEMRLARAEKDVAERPRSAQLWLARLEAAEDLRDEPNVATLWAEGLATASEPNLMWPAYLAFVGRSFDTCTVRTLRQEFGKGLASLREDVDRVRLLHDLCKVELASGHAEFGLGLLQATLELAVNATMTPSLLEAFWRSEAPRIGDSRNSGVADWYVTETPVNLAKPPPKESPAPIEDELPAMAATIDREEAPAASQLIDDDSAILEKFDRVRSLKDDGTVYRSALYRSH